MKMCERFEYMMELGGKTCFDFWDFEINKFIEIDLPHSANKQDEYGTIKVNGTEMAREYDYFSFKKALKELQSKLYQKEQYK